MMKSDPASLRALYGRHSRSEYESLLLSIVERIRVLLAPTQIRFQIKQRVKEFDEYLKKLQIGSDGFPRVERIEDMMGIRIVCPFLEDLSEVEKILSREFSVTEVDVKRLGQSFREFGYDSTHLLLAFNDGDGVLHPLPCVSPVCEIQLRTILQDAWAEVEHALIYKSEWPIPTYEIRRKLAALNANLTLGDIIFQELRDFQREMLLKQSKRRSLTDESLAILSKNEIHAKLLDDEANRVTRNNLEKIVIAALTAHAEESFETAVGLYSRALDMPGGESVRSILLNHRGMACLSLGELEKAADDFSAALSCDAANYRAFYNLGMVRRLKENRTGALEAFAACLTLNPSFNEARVKQIQLLLEMDDPAGAEKALTEMRRYTPDSPALESLEKEAAHLRGKSGRS